jgi:hypothetical protein
MVPCRTVIAEVSPDSVTEVVCELPLKLAVMVAFCVLVTPVADAVKLDEPDPAATITDGGTARLVLLLLSATVVPPLGAALLRVTVQLDVPGVGIEDGLQTTERKLCGLPTVTTPPDPFTTPLSPAGVAATVLVKPMLTVPEETEGVTLIVATTPSLISVAFNPLATHTDPAPFGTQFTDLLVELRALPALTELEVTSDGGYVSVHCNEAGR